MSGRASRHLEQRFPDREIQIARWKRADPDFRDLRRDYEDCARVLDDISRSPVPDLKRVKEYRELKIALELELLHHLGSDRRQRLLSLLHYDHGRPNRDCQGPGARNFDYFRLQSQ